jgi:hypothetical protein
MNEPLLPLTLRDKTVAPINNSGTCISVNMACRRYVWAHLEQIFLPGSSLRYEDTSYSLLNERERNDLLSLIINRELTLKNHILCCLSVSPSSSFLPFRAYQFRTVSLLIGNLCLSGLTLETRPLASRIAIWQGRAYHAGRFSSVLVITHSAADKVLFSFFSCKLLSHPLSTSAAGGPVP